MLAYLYPDVRGIASYSNSAQQFHGPFLKDVKGVWAPMSNP